MLCFCITVLNEHTTYLYFFITTLRGNMHLASSHIIQMRKHNFNYVPFSFKPFNQLLLDCYIVHLTVLEIHCNSIHRIKENRLLK